jgi:hypothetical protein
VNEPAYCINHPDTPTGLRCNKCGSPICTRCLIRTPVGYRCKNCVKSQQAVFYTAQWYDYLIAGALALVISTLAQGVLIFVPYFIVALFAGPLVGNAITAAIRLATAKRRGQYTALIVSGVIVGSALPCLLLYLITTDVGGLLANLIYIALAAGSAHAFLRIGQK